MVIVLAAVVELAPSVVIVTAPEPVIFRVDKSVAVRAVTTTALLLVEAKLVVSSLLAVIPVMV